MRVGWTKYEGHFLAITGVDEATKQYYILDPWDVYRAPVAIGYDNLRAYRGKGVWTDTYLIKGLREGQGGGGVALAARDPEQAGGASPRDMMSEDIRMANEVEAPIFTVGLDDLASGQALAGQAFEELQKIGTQRFSDEGVFEKAQAAEGFYFRPDCEGSAKRIREVVAKLRDPKVLLIPELLVSVVLGSKDGEVTVQPFGRRPPFLADRSYLRSEFVKLITTQAVKKLEDRDKYSDAEEELSRPVGRGSGYAVRSRSRSNARYE
jgi:hypothetical protein